MMSSLISMTDTYVPGWIQSRTHTLQIGTPTAQDCSNSLRSISQWSELL
jgi:hypothetical protein